MQQKHLPARTSATITPRDLPGMAPSGKSASPDRVSPDATASTSQRASPSPSNGE